MNLKDVAKIGGMRIRREGKFDSLGLIPHNKPRQLVFAESEEFIRMAIGKDNVSCIITTEKLAGAVPDKLGAAFSAQPKKSFYDIHEHLAQKTNFYGKGFKTSIAKSASIHPTACVAKKNVKIGERCRIGPHVVIMENSVLEKDVTIRSGTVIGEAGFEFKRLEGTLRPVTHAGGVLIHDRVEIQSNTVVCRGIFGDNTEIGKDTKIDNLIHIAHCVKIGERCMIVAGAMIAGSVVMGDDVWVGPMASVSSGLTVGNKAFITLGAVVTKDVSPGQKVSGNFAIDHERFLAFIRSIR
jgi:UDP-3-O-[3-hydroxymyristoyl] glucosamine N-acyltransferase